jgi:diacylglycerol kinase (ATP)
VAVGGDGTWSNVAGVLVAERADCRLALIAAGTGNDLAKNAGAPATNPVATARLVAANQERAIDVGFVDDRCFVNCAGFGFDAAVLEAASHRRWPGGSIHYLAHALEQLVGFAGVDASHDETPLISHLLLVAANGARFGGTFAIAPGADIDDGVLDLIAVRNVGAIDRLRLFAAATRGGHLGHRGVMHRQFAEMRLRFRAPPVYEADGELVRAPGREVTIRCVPRALRVVSAARAPG